MANAVIAQTNFTAGELSPRLYGRVDIARYANGAKEILNGIPVVHGGVKRRDGLLHVATAKTAGKKIRMIPYVFNQSQAYMLEFGDLYMRVYKDGAPVMLSGSPYEISTPYTESILQELDYVQGEDTMFIAHQTMAIRSLKRIAHDSWTLAATSFICEPFDELTASPNKDCTPSHIDASGIDPVGTTITLTLSGAGWSAGDVGKYVRINRGLIKITAYTSTTVVSGKIMQQMDSSIAAPAGSWTLEQSVWGGANGYPSTVTLYEQRLFAAGSSGFPQAIWASRIGEYLNFELGVTDSDAFSFTIASDELNPILHLCQTQVLIAMTAGGEFTIQGGQSKAITPTNIQVKNQGAHGAKQVRSVRAGNEMLYVQKSGKRLMGIAYKFDVDQYASNDISLLAEHLAKAGIIDMAWQHTPESILWMVRSDGVLLSLTLNRDQDVIAWAQHNTDGLVESVATIPVAEGMEVWVSVLRTVNGSATRRIERMTDTALLDAAITGSSSAPGAATWSGLSHLEGKKVDILADGVVMTSQTVSGGQITIERNALNVVIGLPYTTRVVTLTPEVAGATGSSQASSYRISEVTLRLLETLGSRINGQDIAFRRLGAGVLDQAVLPYTGDYRMETLGFERGLAEITIEQPYPLPFHLLSVIKRLTVNNG